MAPKRQLDASEQTGRDRKRQKINHARTIETGKPITFAAPPVLQQNPPSIDVGKFTEARAFEINAMQKAIKSVRSAASTRVWQSLPRHLRRRAASHNVRRVPVRLREKARQEMDPSKKKLLQRFIAKLSKSKNQTRTEDLLKRQRKKRWLETHIWHAKRMKMVEIWGYRLALHPTEKSFRPSHRAAAHGCIVHDASYMAVIEIKGQLEILKRAFGRVCNPSSLSPAAARYSNGSRVCETELFGDAAYPLDFIAPIQVLWQALDSSTTKPLQLKEGKLGAISSQSGDSVEITTRIAWVRVHPAAYEKASRALSEAAMAVLESEKESGRPSVEVEIADLRGQFNCFDLTGPKSSQVIRGALSPVKQCTGDTKKHFWNSICELRTPGSCPRGMVVGLQVHDPRLKFPPKNVTINEQEYKAAAKPFSVTPSAALASSELWSEDIRLGLSKPKFRKRDLDERRAKQLVPGTALNPMQQDDRVPIIIFQRTLSAPISTSGGTREPPGQSMHGWTIITPLGWGMPFLSSLIFTGSRIGGLREVKSQAMESNLPYFPHDFSGSDLGHEAQVSLGQVTKAKWERKPPAKRASFEALDTRSPFEPDWGVVCGVKQAPRSEEGFEETQRMEEDPVKLWLLYGQDSREVVNSIITAGNPAKALLQCMDASRLSRSLPSLNIDAQNLYKGALVIVKVTPCGRGTPTDMSAIYTVSTEEAASWADRSVHNDKEAYEIFQKGNTSDDIIGYVTSGRQSLSHGKGLGIGGISLAKLVESMRRSGPVEGIRPHLLKIREAHGEIYRPVVVEVI